MYLHVFPVYHSFYDFFISFFITFPCVGIGVDLNLKNRERINHVKR